LRRTLAKRGKKGYSNLVKKVTKPLDAGGIFMGHLEHAHEHEHPHTHDSETHSHGEGHEHSHTHPHAADGEQAVAVLQYMLDHNIHHAAELNDLAQQFTGEAQRQLLHAVEAFDQGNGYLSAALELLKS